MAISVSLFSQLLLMKLVHSLFPLFHRNRVYENGVYYGLNLKGVYDIFKKGDIHKERSHLHSERQIPKIVASNGTTTRTPVKHILHIWIIQSNLKIWWTTFMDGPMGNYLHTHYPLSIPARSSYFSRIKIFIWL